MEDVNPANTILGMPIRTRLFDVALQQWQGIVASDDPILGGSAVMYRPDKVIKAGGRKA